MTLQSSTATLIPLFSSSELTGCGYPGLLDRKNRSDMCPRWESNPRLSACKASTSSTRPGSLLNHFKYFNSRVLNAFKSCNPNLGWSSGAMVMGKLPVPGRLTDMDNSTKRTYCSRCGWGCLDICFLKSIISLFFLPHSRRRPDID